MITIKAIVNIAAKIQCPGPTSIIICKYANRFRNIVFQFKLKTKQTHNMKKHLLLLALVIIGNAAFSQQRLVFSESFSQASCGPCATQNPAFKALLEANSSKIVAIKYQVSWPGFDPMYNHNPSEIDSRVSYYGITGVPDRVLDGENINVTQSLIDTRYAVPSPINLTMTHTLSADFSSANVSVTIDAPSAWSASNTVLQVAMVEKKISFASAPGSNGEKDFYDVMRKMLPNANGTPVDMSNFTNENGTQTFTFNNVAIPSYIYDLSQVRFIAWVQNNTSKEVYQAAITEPELLPNYGVISNLNLANNYSCENQLTGVTATIKNDGNTVINTATVNYRIDNGAVQTYDFNGSIAVGGTADVTLPAANTTSGSHVLTVFLNNINGSGSTNPLGTTTTTFATISAPGSTGNFLQNFANSSFPYANYYLASPSGNNWDRVTANTGSLRYNNYTYTAGSVGEVYLAPIDLSSISNKAMSFDVAYRQYQAENDRLQVLVSSDCGANWSNLFDKEGAGLKTQEPATSPFTPASSSQWRTESVDLNNFASANKIIIKFKATSDYGNNLFIDNINIGTVGVEIVDNLENAVSVYPNPSNEMAFVRFTTNSTENIQITLVNTLGQVVYNQSYGTLGLGDQMLSFYTSDLTSGIYLVNLKVGEQTITKRLTVTH